MRHHPVLWNPTDKSGISSAAVCSGLPLKAGSYIKDTILTTTVVYSATSGSTVQTSVELTPLVEWRKILSQLWFYKIMSCFSKSRKDPWTAEFQGSHVINCCCDCMCDVKDPLNYTVNRVLRSEDFQGCVYPQRAWITHNPLRTNCQNWRWRPLQWCKPRHLLAHSNVCSPNARRESYLASVRPDLEGPILSRKHPWL